MKILYVTKRVIDVFFGDGWEQWGRFLVVGDHLKKLKGSNFSQLQMTFLRKEVLK